MFFEMRFDLGTLDSGERSLPFGLLVCFFFCFVLFFVFCRADVKVNSQFCHLSSENRNWIVNFEYLYAKCTAVLLQIARQFRFASKFW